MHHQRHPIRAAAPTKQPLEATRGCSVLPTTTAPSFSSGRSIARNSFTDLVAVNPHEGTVQMMMMQQQEQERSKATGVSSALASSSTAPSLRMRTSVNAWGESSSHHHHHPTDDHTKRSTATTSTQGTFMSDDLSSSPSTGERGSKSASSSSPLSPRSAGANLLMMKMLAKEVAAALLRETSEDGVNREGVGGILGLEKLTMLDLGARQQQRRIHRQASCSDDDDLSFDDDDDDCDDTETEHRKLGALSALESFESDDVDVESVVQMVMATVQRQQQKKQEVDAKGGKKSLTAARESATVTTAKPTGSPSKRSVSNTASPRTPTTPTDKLTKNPRKSPSKSSYSSPSKSSDPLLLSSRTSSHTIQTKVSELSLGSGSKKAVQMDIWHPDFWSLQEEEGLASSPTKKTPPAAVVVEDVRRIDEPCDDNNDDDDESTLDGGIDNDIDDDDDVSVLSDISGLTDAWNAEGLRKKAELRRLAKAADASASPHKSGLVSKLLFGNSSNKTKTGGSKSSSSKIDESNSLIGSQIGTADTHSVSTRRSKTSVSSYGTTFSPTKATKAPRSSMTTSSTTKSVTSMGSASSRRSQGTAKIAGASRTSSSSSSQHPIGRTVSFSTVQVRVYERILCDNPAVSSGLSIGIGWRYMEQADVDGSSQHGNNSAPNATTNASAAVSVDDYELRRTKVRTQSELQLSRRQREAIVREWGHTDRDIAAMKRELNKCRAQRRQTVNNLGAQKVEEAMESVKSKVKSLLFLPS